MSGHPKRVIRLVLTAICSAALACATVPLPTGKETELDLESEAAPTSDASASQATSIVEAPDTPERETPRTQPRHAKPDAGAPSIDAVDVHTEPKPSPGAFEIHLRQVDRATLEVRFLGAQEVSFRGSVAHGEWVSLPPGRYEVLWRAADSFHEAPERTVWQLRPGEKRILEPKFALRQALRDKFVRIPAGPTRLGILGEEVETHVAEFFIGKYEVSMAEYREFARATDHAPPAGAGCNWDMEGVADHPVNCISHDDANAYARWLSGRHAGLVFRLPREEEWEKAARGTRGNVYPWGNIWRWLANLCDSRCREDWARADVDDGFSRTAPRGSYENASAYGAYDLLGNVAEWCQNGSVRGGSYRDYLNNLQTYKPHTPGTPDSVGMRLVAIGVSE